MILSFQTGRSGQTVQTQIRLLVWSGSTVFAITSVSFWMHYSTVKPSYLNFRVITASFPGVQMFTVDPGDRTSVFSLFQNTGGAEETKTKGWVISSPSIPAFSGGGQYLINFIFLRFIEVWGSCKVSVAQRALRELCTGHIAFILRWTSEKMKFIFYIYMLLQPFYTLFSSFLCKFANYTAKKMLLTVDISLPVTSPHDQLTFIDVWTLLV